MQVLGLSILRTQSTIYFKASDATLQAGERWKLEGTKALYLMEASMPIVCNSDCNVRYKGRLHSSMLCTGFEEGEVDACQGDSEGPMVCEFNC